MSFPSFYIDDDFQDIRLAATKKFLSVEMLDVYISCKNQADIIKFIDSIDENDKDLEIFVKLRKYKDLGQIDGAPITDDEALAAKIMRWDSELALFYIIDMYFIKPGAVLTSLSEDTEAVESITDLDVRYGCIAYGVVIK